MNRCCKIFGPVFGIVSFNKAKNKLVVLLWSSSLVKDQAMALTDEVAGLRIFCLLTYGGGDNWISMINYFPFL